MMKFGKTLALLSMLALLMILPAAAAEVPAPMDVPLAAEEAVEPMSTQQAQQILIDLGILKDRADGKLGPKTKAAIVAFQAQSGLAQTGALDGPTMRALQRVAQTRRSARDIQQRLIDLGYLQDKADGKWGKRSTAALRLFEQLHDLPQTDAADEATLDLMFSDAATALPQKLSSGDSGERVEALQVRLAQFGFLADEPDGVYGKTTVAAVKAVQQLMIDQGYGERYDIAVDGVASPVTQHILFGEDYSPWLRDLAAGDTGDEVLRLETRLSKLGYMDMPADDTLDDYAMEALALFRLQSGMGPMDVVCQEDMDALYSEDAAEAIYCAPHDIAYGDTGRSVTEMEQALFQGGMLQGLPTGSFNGEVEKALKRLSTYLTKKKDVNAGLFSDPKAVSKEAQRLLQNGLLDYRQDVSGKTKNTAEIMRVQRRLFTLFYLDKKGIDGLFGADSRNALKAFQAANGLEETGVADEDTQRVLFSEEAVSKPLPYRVEVSIADQTVSVYELDGDSYVLTQTFNCSTGRNNTTPRGIFLDGFPVHRWHYFKDFNCWAQYSFVIEGGIMFHSVIYGSKSERSLRRSSVNNLGNPASHGCIRLTVEDAKWLFEHCKRHSLVILIR